MRRGFALITSLVVLILLAMGTAAVLKSVSSLNTQKTINMQELKAQYLAEAGMQYALYKCRTVGCAAAVGTLSKATTGLEQDIIITLPAAGQINVEVDYPDL